LLSLAVPRYNEANRSDREKGKGDRESACMISSIQYWFGFLGWLVFASSLISNAGLIVRESIELSTCGKPYTAIRAFTIAMIRKVGNTAPKFGIAVLFAVVGFAANDLWRFHHTYVLNDLSVIGVPGDIVAENGVHRILGEREYYLQRLEEPRGQAFSFNFCPDYDPKAKRGSQIAVMVYEVKFSMTPPCRDVGGGGKNGIIFR
jgi:hypothetical protein